MKWAAYGAVAILLGVATAFWSGAVASPPDSDPWAPLDVQAEPTFVTWLKRRRLREQPPACFAALDTAGLRYDRVPDQRGSCPLVNAVRLSGPGYSSGFVATCPLAVALALFERHALRLAAQRWFDRGVRRIEHVGTYACRNVYGREKGRRSEHASANAIDITGFVLSDGRPVSVQRDWGGDSPRARFLRDVRDGACRFFDVVLSPGYNAAHRDHLHFDMGPFRACR